LVVLLRLLISPVAIVLINLIILVPMVLSVFDLLPTIWFQRDFVEPVHIVTTVAVMMIGWGVALEERHVVREMLGMVGRPDEAWQSSLDQLCHRVGVGMLVLGLFADVCVEMIDLPDRIINTSGQEHLLLSISVVLISVGSVILARHILTLMAVALRRNCRLSDAG